MKIHVEIDRIRTMLDNLTRTLPPFPKVETMHFELGTDQGGDPAVYVTVILAERTKSKDWTSENLDPIGDRIREAIHASDVERWPYVRYARPSEWKAAG